MIPHQYGISADIPQTLVFYHLLNVSGKPRWRVSGTRFFGSFQQNVSGSNGTSEKFVLFFWTELCVPFLQVIFDTRFTPPQPFFGEWNWFGQMVNVIPRGNFPYMNFAQHLPKLWFDRVDHVNGEMVNGQPVVALQNISCFLRLSQPKALSWCVCSQRFRICIKSPKYCTLTVLMKVQLPSCLSLSDVHVVIVFTKHWIDWDVLALYAFISIPQWMNRVFSKNLSAFMVTDIPKGIFHTSRLFLDKVCKFVHS